MKHERMSRGDAYVRGTEDFEKARQVAAEALRRHPALMQEQYLRAAIAQLAERLVLRGELRRGSKELSCYFAGAADGERAYRSTMVVCAHEGDDKKKELRSAAIGILLRERINRNSKGFE